MILNLQEKRKYLKITHIIVGIDITKVEFYQHFQFNVNGLMHKDVM